MKRERLKIRFWIIRVLSLLTGIAVAWTILNGSTRLKTLLVTVYQGVGITIIALTPLAIWAVYTAISAGRQGDLTLAYIGTTAQRIGLLGTVIGIVAATIAIGDNLSSGAATAVTSALPAVGQAMVSTAVGFVIAIVCDFFRYINVYSATRQKGGGD